MIHVISIFIEPVSDLLCPIDRGNVIPVETTAIKIELFYYF